MEQAVKIDNSLKKTNALKSPNQRGDKKKQSKTHISLSSADEDSDASMEDVAAAEGDDSSSSVEEGKPTAGQKLQAAIVKGKGKKAH